MLLVKEVFVSSIPINLDFDPPSSVFWGLFLFNVEHVCTHSELNSVEIMIFFVVFTENNH